MATAVSVIAKQIVQLRKSGEDWFVLPDVSDEETDIMLFTVELEMLKNYLVNPSPSSGERAMPYTDGLFRIEIKFPESYPNEVPKVRFLTRIWHPQVALDGKLCEKPLADSWKPHMSIRDFLSLVRDIIASPDKVEGVFNQDAANQLARSVDEFEAQAREETKKWAME